jgi:hypothetical protein
LDLCAICNKPGDITKVMKGGGQEIDVTLDWGHENGGIIGVKRGRDHGDSSPKLLNAPLLGGFPEDMV